MSKLFYNKPKAELLQEVPAVAILDGSIEGSLETYGEQEDFTW